MEEALQANVDAGRRESLVDDYERLSRNLNGTRVAEDPNSLLLVLLCRDGISAELGGSHSADAVQRLLVLDESLRSVADEVTSALPDGLLDRWRASVNPQTDAWWWRLDEVSIETTKERSPWWPVATGILLTISASLTADIARRFLSNGPDFYGALSTISQGAVTIIAGSTLTKAGRNWINRYLSSFGIRPARHPQWYTALALAVLVLVGLFDLSLPTIALRYYDARGQELFREGKLRDAIEHFERATSIAPSEYWPHFDLADAREELFDYDRAISEYGAAIQAKPDFYPAYNNLARLYLAKRKDPESALRAIRKGLVRLDSEMKNKRKDCSTPNEQCDALYALHKNMAWVNVEKHWYDLAKADIDAAKGANAQLGGIYCLLAQVEVAQKHTDEASKAWGRCLVAAKPQMTGNTRNQREDLQETWIAMAQEWEYQLKR